MRNLVCQEANNVLAMVYRKAEAKMLAINSRTKVPLNIFRRKIAHIGVSLMIALIPTSYSTSAWSGSQPNFVCEK